MVGGRRVSLGSDDDVDSNLSDVASVVGAATVLYPTQPPSPALSPSPTRPPQAQLDAVQPPVAQPKRKRHRTKMPPP